MSVINMKQATLAIGLLTGAATNAFATCDSCFPGQGDSISLSGTNNNTLTANPTAVANPTLIATPTAVANPTLIANPSSFATASSFSAGGAANVDLFNGNTNIVTPTQTTIVNTDGTVGPVSATGGTVGPVTAMGGTVQPGAVNNDIDFNAPKPAASTAPATPVINNSGHGCFENDGGISFGAQTIAGGGTIGLSFGESYNKICAGDQAAYTVINAGVTSNDPKKISLGVATAAEMSGDVKKALKGVQDESSEYGTLVGFFTPKAQTAPAPVQQQPQYIPVPMMIAPTQFHNGGLMPSRK